MYELYGQLILATVLGAVVGLERQLSKKAAGMRTFALVSLGAAFFTIISVIAVDLYPSSNAIDVTRIPAQIVLGVGFIGAGLIIFHRSHVTGLTTAAGLWVASAIGMAVGFKLYLLAIFTAILVFVIFVIFWFIENKFINKLAGSPPEQESENNV